MRIIAGKYKGLRFPAFHSKDIRPTTDKSKEAIFTYFDSKYELEECHCLDLFAGSGTVSIEFLSRGVKSMTSLDKGKESTQYLLGLKKQLKSPDNWEITQQDVNRFITQVDIALYDIVFADPPYNMSSLHSFTDKVIDKMKESACFVLEHKSEIRFTSPYLRETKNYGKSAFSIFRREP